MVVTALASVLLVTLVVTAVTAIGRGTVPARERRPLAGRTPSDLGVGLAADLVRGVRELDRTSPVVARVDRAIGCR
jgi:hypothetical protein